MAGGTCNLYNGWARNIVIKISKQTNSCRRLTVFCIVHDYMYSFPKHCELGKSLVHTLVHIS